MRTKLQALIYAINTLQEFGVELKELAISNESMTEIVSDREFIHVGYRGPEPGGVTVCGVQVMVQR